MGGMNEMPLRVPVEWLRASLGAPDLVVVDVALGAAGRLRIPGAVEMDLDGRFSDAACDLPHTMPQPAEFERQVRSLGIDSSSRIVLYDSRGVYSSPRAWWMFRAMGHVSVGVLDGGLPAWLDAGCAVSTESSGVRCEGGFRVRPETGWFCDSEAVVRALGHPECAVIDVRSQGRFAGVEPEPRPGLRPGHIPGSRNLPFTGVLDSGRYRSVGQLRGILAGAVGIRRRLVFSCGSGVTACIGAFAAKLAGYEDVQVYDGSWSEWGRPSSLRPVSIGLA